MAIERIHPRERAAQARRALAGGASTRPGIVHRLDKDTSGLLLVAKDDLAGLPRGCAEAARDRAHLPRTGPWTPMPAPSGTIEAPIGRHPRQAVGDGGLAQRRGPR